MSDTTGETVTTEDSIWQKIPAIWKVAGVFIAIIGFAVSGYDRYDDLRDRVGSLETTLQNAGVAELPGRISGLGGRIDRFEADIVRKADLSDYVGQDKLLSEACVLTARAEKHDYQAREKAYEELISAMRLAEAAFAGRNLTAPEERQLLGIIELRSSFEKRKSEAEREIAVREQRINNPENC